MFLESLTITHYNKDLCNWILSRFSRSLKEDHQHLFHSHRLLHNRVLLRPPHLCCHHQPNHQASCPRHPTAPHHSPPRTPQNLSCYSQQGVAVLVLALVPAAKVVSLVVLFCHCLVTFFVEYKAI